MVKNLKEEKRTLNNDEIDVSSETSTSSSSDFDYEITKLKEEDLDQVLIFNRKAKIYDNVLDISNKMLNGFYCTRSGDFILNICGYIDIEDYKKLITKKLKKSIREFINKNDLKILICEKYTNTPYKCIVKCLEELDMVDSDFLFVSRCKEIKKSELEEVKSIFYEFKEEDLRIFPENHEEIFFIANNLKSKIVCSGDNYYRLCILNKNMLKKYIKCIEKEMK